MWITCLTNLSDKWSDSDRVSVKQIHRIRFTSRRECKRIQQKTRKHAHSETEKTETNLLPSNLCQSPNKQYKVCNNEDDKLEYIHLFMLCISYPIIYFISKFDPHDRHILSWRLGLENISTAILPLPQIQEEQLSVTGERMYTKY